MRRVVLALLPLASLASAADYTITRSTTVADGAPIEQTEYWSENRLVVDDSAQRLILDFSARSFTSVDKGRRTYVAVPLDDVRRQLLLVGLLAEELPSAARELLGLGSRTITLARTGNSTMLAGREATEYAIAGDGVTGWAWLAEDLDPGAILGDGAAAWWRGGGPLRGIGPLADIGQAIGQAKLRGMPVWAWLTAGSEDRAAIIRSEVVAIHEVAPPADIGQVPDGYTKTPSPLES